TSPQSRGRATAPTSTPWARRRSGRSTRPAARQSRWAQACLWARSSGWATSVATNRRSSGQDAAAALADPQAGHLARADADEGRAKCPAYGNGKPFGLATDQGIQFGRSGLYMERSSPPSMPIVLPVIQ